MTPRLSQLPRYALLLLLAVVFLVPFYLIVRNALMTDDQITSLHWAWLPAAPHWDNFRKSCSPIPRPPRC